MGSNSPSQRKPVRLSLVINPKRPGMALEWRGWGYGHIVKHHGCQEVAFPHVSIPWSTWLIDTGHKTSLTVFNSSSFFFFFDKQWKFWSFLFKYICGLKLKSSAGRRSSEAMFSQTFSRDHFSSWTLKDSLNASSRPLYSCLSMLSNRTGT